MVEEQRAAPERPVRNWGIPLGRVAGVPVFLTASWLVLAVLIMITYQGYLAVRRPELPQSLAYLVGAGLVLSLLVSVLLHELGHALTARRFGIGVRGITLELLGGYTELDRDAPSPAVELLVSLAGPAVSLVLGAVAAAAAAVLPDRTLLEELAFQLALSNLVVAAFNVLPGLPLDGGRALRAGIWALSRDRHLGDRVAGWVGRLVAVASVVFVVLLVSAHVITVFGALLTVLVALTLWTGAGQAIRAGRLGPRVPLLNAGQLARPLFAVPSGTPLAEAQRRYAEAVTDDSGREPVLAVVNSSGQLIGLVDETAAAQVPAERRPWITLDAVARSLDPGRILPAELSGHALVEAVRANPGSEYVVTVGEDVLGVLRVADVVQVLEARGPSR
ncbi:MAG: peptidase M50 [Actinobacteria bacterium]|nr:MAG: peptidase M50 [Actinomycetota bacterium]